MTTRLTTFLACVATCVVTAVASRSLAMVLVPPGLELPCQRPAHLEAHRPALRLAAEVAAGEVSLEDYNPSGDVCLGAAAELGDALRASCRRGRALHGWRVRSVEIEGCHTALLLSSPDVPGEPTRHYYVDTYYAPWIVLGREELLVEFEEVAPNQWRPRYIACELVAITVMCLYPPFLPCSADDENCEAPPPVEAWWNALLLRFDPAPQPDGRFLDAVIDCDAGLPAAVALRGHVVCPRVSDTAVHTSRSVQAVDPNELRGPEGAGLQAHVPGDRRLDYAVFFENLATATAPAQEVVVHAELDPAVLDASSIRIGPVTIGRTTIVPLAEGRHATAVMDADPADGRVVRVAAYVDEARGRVTWRLRDLDAITGAPPEDPTVGFLPPNAAPPKGEGSVLFSVAPRGGLSTGIVFVVRAEITFDTNAPIATAPWRNVLDVTPPRSRMTAATLLGSGRVDLAWEAADDGVGVRGVTVLVADDRRQARPWLVESRDRAATFTGEPGATYVFGTQARDAVGNEETLDPATFLLVTVPLDAAADASSDPRGPSATGADGGRPVQRSAGGEPSNGCSCRVARPGPARDSWFAWVLLIVARLRLPGRHRSNPSRPG